MCYYNLFSKKLNKKSIMRQLKEPLLIEILKIKCTIYISVKYDMNNNVNNLFNKDENKDKNRKDL